MSSSHGVQEAHHPTFKQYVAVAIFLFVITAMEFMIIVPEDFRGARWTIAPLALLSIIKFYTVIMFYMHLKFDNKLFTWIFLGGLALGTAVVFALVGLFVAFTPTARDFAETNAVAFVHGETGAPHEPTDSMPEPSGPSDQPGEPGGIPEATVPVAAADGEAVFATGSGGCAACHKIEGLTAGALGPELTHIGTVAGTRKPGLSAEAYIRESIVNPTGFVVEGFTPIMPPNIRSQLSDAEFEGLVQFLLAQE
jgi:cytochrome c oxidase subunit 4